jgi:hypothetical protein
LEGISTPLTALANPPEAKLQHTPANLRGKSDEGPLRTTTTLVGPSPTSSRKVHDADHIATAKRSADLRYSYSIPTGRGNFTCPEQPKGDLAAMAQTDANLIWKIADLLRGPYQPNQYGDVILPFTTCAALTVS